MRQPISTRWQRLPAAIVLVCLTCAVFCPIVGFEFVDCDVRDQVIDNRLIRHLTAENLWKIFTTRNIHSYYPFRTLSFAVDHQLWGVEPAGFNGFKLTNGLIHLSNVLLVFWLILRVFPRPAATNASATAWWDVAAATFCAGLFAVHPVVVEPVAWVAGREELLMTLGALACIHFHISARRLAESRHRPAMTIACHVGAAVSCAAACLSNAVGAVIPLLIVAWDVLTLARPRLRKTLYGTSALWAISVATVVLKRLGETTVGRAREVAVFSPDRLILILKVYWLNVKTLIWPTELAVSYPAVRPEGFADPEVGLGLIAIALTCTALWLARRQKLILFGLLWFGFALAPASQMVPHHIHRADRFLYLPLVGLAVALALGVRPPANARDAPRTAGAIAAALVWSLLGIVSWGQVQTWRNSLAMWENCLRVSPGNGLAHSGVADGLRDAGLYEEAIRHYWTAIQVPPKNVDTLRNFAVLMATCPRKELRNSKLAMLLAQEAVKLMDPPDPAAVMALAEVHAQLGETQAAVARTKEAIALADAAQDPELADDLRRRLKLYQNGGKDRAPPNSAGKD